MQLQLIVIALIVALAASYIGYTFWKKLRKSGCGGGCNCGSKITKADLTKAAQRGRG